MTRAELLELLKKARKQLKKYHVPKDEQTVTLSIDTLENALSEQPTIVRCKDCKFAEYHPEVTGLVGCRKQREFEPETKAVEFHRDNWFCADGRRRDES